MQSDEIDKRYLTLLKGNLANKEELVEQSLQKNTLSAKEFFTSSSASSA